MKYNSDIHHRQSIRLKGFDYSQAGAYFVTVCAWNRECLFGEVVDGGMRLNESGIIIQDIWNTTPNHFENIELDEFMIMPNHCHGIIVINRRGEVSSPDSEKSENKKGGGTPPLRKNTLGQIVAYFKYQSSKRINQIRNTPGNPVWQRNYYEHIIRDDNELTRICEYIINNPLQWAEDENNPVNIKTSNMNKSKRCDTSQKV
ncbi:MAG: hypothetical protein HZC11_00925 [Nitrospirae bacterium]|nr:hypothetical protein [Nitrospirota bacterium]